ncbi:Uncharacterized membrane protein YjjP, DUF1212 family [Aerococcus urinaehominis]|nr:threonine/serine exporter family protein [Aerococcus urinaehominis]SDM20048.1 Uncharacterized membrane protein YjjP, DUF1212 family [Aerococcus urinaehominis]
MNTHKKVLETALLAGQIMTESNAESYRVEDTMNRILSTSKAAYAVAVSFSTSLYAVLDDPSFEQGGFTGIKRISVRSNNMNKIAAVNSVSRRFTNNQISLSQAYEELLVIQQTKSPYSERLQDLAIIGLAMSFSILFGGGWWDLVASTINGIVLMFMYKAVSKFYINSGLSNVIQSLVVTIAAYLMQAYLLPSINTNIVIVSTLMPMVPGTAITNSLRDIFRQDYIAGGARAMEAFLDALMIALGAAVGLIILRGVLF